MDLSQTKISIFDKTQNSAKTTSDDQQHSADVELQWQDRISFKLNSIYNMYFMVYVLYYFIRIALIVWVCETSKNQAEKIRTTIHDVLNSTNNVQVKDELRLFSLQILHCKNTFSAKGFTVDATLLTGIMSGITTYILILIQFLGISHFCDEKTAINITEAI
ncbi:PREDICTED: putative gustatory receptor 28b [Vollenhovia emeryi]|uniref:putative gustatory receptor 28b n=1 Tax=Vollenhovia emeryi TaxID=411798 RepID=UPI0005F52C00|nr:PREDICTED: putative gustatory receptor 28b [Vollenhovia emeryi]